MKAFTKAIFSTSFIILLAGIKLLFAQTSFQVCEVIPATQPLEEEDYEKHLRELIFSLQNNRWIGLEKAEEFRSPVFFCNPSEDKLISAGSQHPFMAAVYTAYGQHRPLVISPDMVWLMIAQGFARHVDRHAEKLREQVVGFEGQKMLNVAIVSLDQKNLENSFPQFSDQIGFYTKGSLKNLISQEFSTSTAKERYAFDITLMDAVSSFFHFSITVSCGIPSITLEGSTEDWEQIRRAAREFGKYDMEWWTAELDPILEEFVKASQGEVNKKFWQGILLENYISVGCAREQSITGWAAKFIPYIENRRNPLLRKYEEGERRPNIKMEDFDSGLSKADVLLDNLGEHSMLEFYAGFVGMIQDKETLALRPEIAWIVAASQKKPDEKILKAYQDFQDNFKQ